MAEPIRILVTGDRNWTNRWIIADRLKKVSPHAVIIEGGARGADSIAREEALLLGLDVETYWANWKRHHRAAGPIRNQKMLDTVPDLVLAFHNDIKSSKGTRHMVEAAYREIIPVEIITE